MKLKDLLEGACYAGRSKPFGADSVRLLVKLELGVPATGGRAINGVVLGLCEPEHGRAAYQTQLPELRPEQECTAVAFARWADARIEPGK